ncbi:protein yceI precursor [alpha proteobacterium U9-1i]|nr:protein yceI precursor [alpha proteobacterium U9-1i]
MRQSIIAAAILLAACAATPAAEAPPATAAAGPAIPYDPATNRNAAEAPSGAYTLDGRHASVIFRLRHGGMALSTYRFDTLSGTLDFNSAAPASSIVNFAIAANSVSTGILNQAGERGFDREIQGFIGAEATPNITFVSTAARLTGPGAGIVSGNLTMNGQTHPVDVEVSYHGWRFNEARQRHTIAFEGHAVIDRTQWGVSGGVVDRVASREIEVFIQAEFNKAN